jgi:hypothetical protein
MLAGTVPLEVVVETVTPSGITCYGGWEFDPRTGAEIDDHLGFGPPPKMTCSFLVWRN